MQLLLLSRQARRLAWRLILRTSSCLPAPAARRGKEADRYMKSSKFHVHFNSRRASQPVFHMPEALCKAALARRPDLSNRVRLTTGWDLENTEALKTASMLVTSMQVPRQNLR